MEFAQSHGLRVVESHQGRRSVVVSGTVAAINKAFDVTLHDYDSPRAANIAAMKAAWVCRMGWPILSRQSRVWTTGRSRPAATPPGIVPPWRSIRQTPNH